jgi:hypothetical protein
VPRAAILDQIRALDPERDHQRIVHLCACYEFPFDMVRALEFALFRTFCVPRISALLDQTGEFLRRAQRRYDDTDLIVSALMNHGYDSPLGRAALRRMNQIHRRFAIADEEYRYVLSTFIFEPIRWIGRFGWRPLSDHERLALFHFWRAVGQRMGIQEIPDDDQVFERFNVAYERAHFHFAETNARVGAAVRDMFLSWFPRPLRPLARPAIYAVMDEPLLDGFGFPRPSPTLRRVVEGAMTLRGRAVRWLPARRRPVIRTELTHRSYPHGWRIEDLGPPSPPIPAAHHLPEVP